MTSQTDPAVTPRRVPEQLPVGGVGLGLDRLVKGELDKLGVLVHSVEGH